MQNSWRSKVLDQFCTPNSIDDISLLFFFYAGYPLQSTVLPPPGCVNKEQTRPPNTIAAALKGVCHEIFELHFFHDANPSGPLINKLKYFQIWYQFRRDIPIFKKLRGVHTTAESISTGGSTKLRESWRKK